MHSTKMRFARVGVAALVGIIATTSGCRRKQKKAWQTIVAHDGRSEIRIPGEWEYEKNPISQKSIQADHVETGTVLTVSTRAKADLHDYTLASFCEGVRRRANRFKRFRETGRREYRIGPSRALEFEREADLGGSPLRELLTCIDGPRFVHYCNISTSGRGWSKRKALLRKIIGTFRERPQPRSRPRPRSAEVGLRPFAARDGRSSLSLPRSWRTVPNLARIHPEATIHVGNGRFRFGLVSSQPKTMVPDVRTLAGYAARTLAFHRKRFTAYKVGPSAEITVGGFAAMQFRRDVAIKGVKSVNLVTFVDTPKHYYQVVLWTYPSDWPAARALFTRIAASFRVAKSPAKKRP